MCRRVQTADPGQDTVIHMAYKCQGERPDVFSSKLLTDLENIDMKFAQDIQGFLFRHGNIIDCKCQ